MSYSVRLHVWYLAVIMVVLAVLTRLLPHPDNVTALGATALFAGAWLPKYVFFLVPLVVLLLTDFILGFYNGLVMLSVYVGFFASTMIGRSVIRHKVIASRVALGVGLGALAFWLISNFGVWLAHHPATLSGFLACYFDALPFLGYSLFGDALYGLLLFGGYHLLSTWLTTTGMLIGDKQP